MQTTEIMFCNLCKLRQYKAGEGPSSTHLACGEEEAMCKCTRSDEKNADLIWEDEDEPLFLLERFCSTCHRLLYAVSEKAKDNEICNCIGSYAAYESSSDENETPEKLRESYQKHPGSDEQEDQITTNDWRITRTETEWKGAKETVSEEIETVRTRVRKRR